MLRRNWLSQRLVVKRATCCTSAKACKYWLWAILDARFGITVAAMNVIETKLAGVLIIEPRVFGDHRGFFKETFQAERYKEAGIALPFVQDNHSRSLHGVLRGLHLQKSRPQGKLVNCSVGSIFDVAVDVDPRSGSFGTSGDVCFYSGLLHRKQRTQHSDAPACD